MSAFKLLWVALQTLFIGLKLTGHIAWSWLWVLALLWIPVALYLIGTALLVACGKDKEFR